VRRTKNWGATSFGSPDRIVTTPRYAAIGKREAIGPAFRLLLDQRCRLKPPIKSKWLSRLITGKAIVRMHLGAATA